jgi:hypothetical protein
MTLAGLDTPLDILTRVFGYHAFRGRQAAIIDHVVGGGDALVMMPTGGGKSLCYQVPALVRAAARGGVAADRADGRPGRCAARAGRGRGFAQSTPAGRRSAAIERDLLAGELKVLYMAPERLVGAAHAGTAARSAGGADRDRRGALRVAVGPRFPRRNTCSLVCSASAFPACRAWR